MDTAVTVVFLLMAGPLVVAGGLYLKDKYTK